MDNYFKGLNNGHIEHLFLHGASGSGKTFCTLYMLSKHRPKSSYVDCSVYKTRSAIVAKILIDFGFPVARRGVSFDYLYEKLDNFLRENKVLIVLDDLQKLHDSEIFNDLIGKASVIAISIDDALCLDSKATGLFLPIKIEFPGYTKDELTDILRQRFESPDNALEQIAVYAGKHNGNCRLAVECSRRIQQRWSKIDMPCVLTWLNEINGMK